MRDTHQIVRPATDRQIQYAESLGIDPEGKSFRVLSAEIEDVLEARAIATMEELEIEPGDIVRYVGDRDDLPEELVVSSFGADGYLHFRGTKKYCRPWFVEPVSS